MNHLIRGLSAFLFAVSAALAPAAEPPKDIADLFPPGTLAYAELHNTAELAPQLAAVFKGTVLEDSLPFIHARKDAAKTMMELGNKQSVALLGLIASPETLAEFKRVRIAAGVTGFATNGDPEAAVVILTHDSPAAGLAARAFLTMTTQLRRVGDVAKVPIFQYRNPNFSYDNNGNQIIQNDKAFTDGPHEPTFAYSPGLFVMGTSKASVGDAIKRFAGEEKGGLSGTAAFKAAAADHRQTGLFIFVNYPEFSTRFSTARRGVELPRGANNDLRSALFGGESNLIELFNLTANPKAVQILAGSVRFRDGGLACTVAAKFDPAHKSPVLELLSGPGLKPELLHHAARPATYALALALPEKNRAEAVIGFLDAVAKSKGEIGRLPRDVVRELSEKHRIAVADGLIGKLQSAIVVMPGKQELPKGGKPGPMLVLHAADAAAATAWEDFLPKLLGELAGAAMPPQPSSETINGTKVMTVSGAGLRWNAPVHFARNGALVAIGLDRKLVAGAVVANAANSVASGGIPSPGGDAAALAGVISLGEVIPALFEGQEGGADVVPGDGVLRLPNGQPIPESLLEELKKARKEFAGALGTLAPATISARRTGNELRIELYQSKVQQGALKTVIDAAANWLDRSVGMGGEIRTFSGRGGIRRR